MTWALAEACQLFAVSYSVRASLKCLKRLSSISAATEGGSEGRANGASSMTALQEALMFWVIYGVYMVFEQHVECAVRWMPGYYYAKAAFIVVVAFPRLQLTKFVFHKGVVPTLEECNRLLVDSGGSAPSLQSVVFHAPLVLLSLALPFFGPEVGDKEKEEEDVVGTETLPGEDEGVDEGGEGEGEAEVKEVRGEEEEEDSWVAAPPLPPPISPLPSPRSPNSADCLLSPSKSLSPGFTRLSDSLKGRIKDSSRRLSSLAAIINRLGSPKSPQKGDDDSADKTRRFLSAPWRSSGGSKVSPEPSFPPQPLPLPPTRAQLSGSLPSSPASTLDRAVTSVRSMFSLDVHSPSANSLRRRQSLMGRPSPPQPARAAPSPTLLPPLEEALRRGNVSSRRGHGHGNR